MKPQVSGSFLSLLLPCLVLSLVIMAVPVHAARYQVPLDDRQWDFDQVNALICSLSRTIPGFGEVSLAIRAGQVSQVTLHTLSLRGFDGRASCFMKPALWNRMDTSVELGVQVREVSEGLQFALSIPPLDWIDMLRRPYRLYLDVYDQDAISLLSLELPTTGFSFHIPELTDCLVNLLPYNFEQLEKTTLYFEAGETRLTRQQQLKLSDLSRYMEWDGTVTGLSIDAHSDNSGSRLDNLRLSKERANVVYNYLLSKEIKPTQVIHLRHHGERYPAVSNASREGRELNRRVLVTLKRGVQRDFVQSEMAGKGNTQL